MTSSTRRRVDSLHPTDDFGPDARSLTRNDFVYRRGSQWTESAGIRKDGPQRATDEIFVRDFVSECEEVSARNLREYADYLEGRVVTEPGKAIVGALGFLGEDETAEQLYEELIRLLARAAQVGFAVRPDEDDVA